ncbi:unnamed protein product [Polarella glacialis]|uniref:Uncharacterized protein n=1 Tax=Polarella glacialis TaxID=89957 RepID=A0A813ER41_POLGL|nr:unnamed protein product [Polarella glacialis]
MWAIAQTTEPRWMDQMHLAPDDAAAAVEKSVEAYDTFATVASLVFGFGVSIMYDALKDSITDTWDETPAIWFNGLGVIVVAGSLLPTMVLSFRAGMVRRILSHPQEDGSQASQAREFTIRTNYMSVPCMMGLILSLFALVAQIAMLLHQNVDQFVFLISSCIGGPVIVLALVCIVHITTYEVAPGPRGMPMPAPPPFLQAPDGPLPPGAMRPEAPPPGSGDGYGPLAGTEPEEDSALLDGPWSQEKCMLLEGKDAQADALAGKCIVMTPNIHVWSSIAAVLTFLDDSQYGDEMLRIKNQGFFVVALSQRPYLFYVSEEKKKAGLDLIRKPPFQATGEEHLGVIQEHLHSKTAIFMELNKQGVLSDTELAELTGELLLKHLDSDEKIRDLVWFKEPTGGRDVLALQVLKCLRDQGTINAEVSAVVKMEVMRRLKAQITEKSGNYRT